MAPKIYKVTKSATFEKDVARLEKKVSRLGEFIVGVEEVLSRNPTYGKPTKNKYVLAFNMMPLNGNPQVTLYYLHTQTEVVFLYLRADGDPKPPPIMM